MRRDFRLRPILITVLLVLLFGAVSLPAAAQTPAYITNASRVNLRSGPGAGFPVVTVMANGQLVTVIGSNADSSWLQLRLISNLPDGSMRGMSIFPTRAAARSRSHNRPDA